MHMDVNHLPLTLTQPYVVMTVFAEKNVLHCLRVVAFSAVHHWS